MLDEIKDTDELFVMGPSELKVHLRTKIENDKHISAKLKGVASADYITLNECVARVKEFYN